MRMITAYRTLDGRAHMDERSAKAWADECYGDHLTAHAHKLAALEKYTAILDYLDTHAEALAMLAKLKADRDTITDETNQD